MKNGMAFIGLHEIDLGGARLLPGFIDRYLD